MLKKYLNMVCILLLTSLNGYANTPNTDTIILAGKLLDVESGNMLSKQMVVIHQGRISAISAIPSSLPTANIIDLSTKTVLPGLIDCHTHLVGDPNDADPVSELKKTSAERAFESIPNARTTLLAGFTTVRDLGTYRAFVDVALRDAINRHDVIGPRMFVAGAYLTITGGGGAINGIAPDITLPWDLRFGVANGVDEVRERTRAITQYNVDVIKVIATGAFLSHGSNPMTDDFSYPEIRAAVQEANKKGLRVAAHAHGISGVKNAIRAGVASIEHGVMLDQDAIHMMKQHGTYLVADIYDEECIMDTKQTNLPNEPDDFRAKEQNFGLVQRENFKKAVQAGVHIAFGTDASVCPHGTNARQLAYQVQYGQTQLAAIQSATINAAKLLGQDAKLGSLKVGKYADIIAVDGDPLANIRQMEKVDFVMKEGIIYKNNK